MSAIEYTPLSAPLRALLDKFYRTHNSPMRAAGDGQMWVARDAQIVAGLNLTPVAHGHWLTGLFVDPQRRGQGLAGRLVEQALERIGEPVWLFCHPDLRGLYERMGFSCDPRLPPALADRLARYTRSKRLIAMGMEPLARPSIDNL